MRFPLRLKFVFFATLLAVIPLLLVGQNLTRLTRDELKSAANEDLTTVASGLRTSFDNTFQGRWLTPLMVIRSAIDSKELGVPQKVSLLTLGLQELPNVVSLQLSIQGSDLPILVSNQDYAARLTAGGLDPVTELTVSPEVIQSISDAGQFGRPIVSQQPVTGDWIATLALPLGSKIAGRQVIMAAKINLAPLVEMLRRHPFSRRGEITIVDQNGRSVLTDPVQDLANRKIVASTLPLITATARADTLEPYLRPNGTAMLGAYTFPESFQWAIITELSETNAYAVVNAITRQILFVGLIGFTLACTSALIFGRRMSRPILKIGEVAALVGEGDFSARVEDVNSRDEIGDLAVLFNKMIRQLGQRMELMKFVSHGTMSAIRNADKDGMSRGGERRAVAVIFTDIRGYTEFSERVSPEVVIEALNKYFDVQTRLVENNQGDVDKFIGDALVAVFEGENKERRAVTCSVEIIEAMAELLNIYPEYNLSVGVGVASGEVVMGAMGAKDRMDFTVLGSTVNLSARLCSKAEPGQVLVDLATRDLALDLEQVTFDTLDPIPLKGFTNPVPTFAARQASAPSETDTPETAHS